MFIGKHKLISILEALLMASPTPLSIDKIMLILVEVNDAKIEANKNYDALVPTKIEIRQCLIELQQNFENKTVELKEVSSGFRFQIRTEYGKWVSKLWSVKPQKYSRALLETLALIAYRQPITRGDIEDIRGVSVSSHIMKTLIERDWVKVIGHRDVPGRPSMYATTKQFLDYFSLKSLDQLPPLEELMDLDKIDPELDFGLQVEETEH